MRDAWYIVHDYRVLENRKLVPTPTCAHCENMLYIGIGKKDQPAYRCFTCNTTTLLGDTELEKMEEFINGNAAGYVSFEL